MDVPREGDRIAGKYVVEKVLGEGGMGVVVAARHEALDQRVAIKFLLPHVVSDPLIVERFAREARAAAKIQSAHVARVIDVGTLDDGSPYMVMEYLEGEDVEAYLERKGPLEIADAVGILIEACEAIAEAHMAGIVHRDLKPANLFLARTPGRRIVKVLDFGISKFSKDTKGPKTQTGGLLGTPYYMSPEQLTDTKNVDGRSDIWTLGVILHQLLSGVVPFFGETLPEVVGQILKNMPGKLRETRADVPEALEHVIQKCMSSNPALRFADVGELVTALAPFAPGSQAHVAAVTRSLTGMSGPPSARNPVSVAPTVSTDGPLPPPTGSALEIDLVRRSDRPASAGTLGAVANSEAPKRARSPLPYVVMAVAAATAIGVVAFVMGKGTGGAATAGKEASPPASTSAPVSLPPSASVPVGVAALSASAVPSVAPSATTAPTVAVPHTATATTATAKPPPSVAATTHATATATPTATATATSNPMNMGLK